MPKADIVVERKKRQAIIDDRAMQRRALAMWARKMNYIQIASELHVSGWTVGQLIKKGLYYLDVPEAKERKSQMNLALDEEERMAWATAVRPGYQVSASGRIVFEPVPDATGRQVPVVDTGRRLEALGVLLRIHDRRAKLNGLDAPAQLSVAVTLETAMAAVELLEAEAARQEAAAGTYPLLTALPALEAGAG